MKTTILNFFGGAGIGKTTQAASLFAELKKRNASVELVKEYAKEYIYLGREDKLINDKLTIFLEQRHRQEIYVGKVRLVITDSPLLLCGVYQQYHERTLDCDGSEHPLIAFARSAFARYENINILLKRNPVAHPYRQDGRMQTEAEAVIVDGMIKEELDFLKEPYAEYLYADDLADIIIDDLLTDPPRGAF